ncbi:MAG: MerR family transcriptional regulator [Acidobacteriota bacterium]
MTTAGDTTLTHALLAKALGVTVTTIKSYRRKFPEFFRTASLGKPIRFPAEVLELCRRIRHHFKRGLSVEETRKRLAQEFEAVAQAPEEATAPQPAPEQGNASAQRIEDLLEGLFDLQNRTHSLMAELLAKLDTVADRLGQPQPAAGQTVRAARPAPSGRIQRAMDDTTRAGLVRPGSAPRRDDPAPAAGANAASPVSLASSSAQAGHSGAGTGTAREGDPEQADQANGLRPPAQFLGMPVVVLSSGGDFLGVTNVTGRPFTLEQFEAFLVGRARAEGGFSAAWVRQGQQWTLRLEGTHDGQDEAREHHFLQAVTPRGNTVARFASLSVNGKPASDAELQTFLRQVKDSLAS